MSRESMQPDRSAGSGARVLEADGLTDLQTGEFLVRVRGAGVNRMDRKIRRSDLRLILWMRFPHIPGGDISSS
jgi:NADPH:quinone reductase-like Zn-dependent oxidoreductase